MCSLSYPLEVGGLELKNPVMNAAGVLGFGASYADYLDLNALGALVSRSLTLKARRGNPAPRLWETAAGMLNCVGMENPGLETFSEKFYPSLTTLDTKLVMSIWGEPKELEQLAKSLSELESVAALELNFYLSWEDYLALGAGGYRKLIADNLDAVLANTDLPVWGKLSPDLADPLEIAALATDKGVSALVVANTWHGMALEPSEGMRMLSQLSGGLSGPAIKPLSLLLAATITRELSVDVIGSGGIISVEDVREYLFAGAKAVAVGSGNFSDPVLMATIINDLNKSAIREVTGDQQEDTH